MAMLNNQMVNHAWTKFEHGMVMNWPLDINTFLSGFMMIYGCVWKWNMTRWRSQEKKDVDESSKSGGLKSCFQTHSNHILLLNLLVVYLPLWKIWKSVGILIPNIKMFQTTNQLT